MDFFHPKASQYLIIVGDRVLEVFTDPVKAQRYAQEGIDAGLEFSGYWTEPTGQRGEYGPEARWHELSLDEPAFMGEFHCWTCKVEPDGGRRASAGCLPQHDYIFVKANA